MELSFAAPLWAWAFSSLLLPILIHFFARRQQPPRRFAPIRFLQADSEQGRARRISDWWLLLLRLLLLAIWVLVLMAPSLSYRVLRERELTLWHPALSLPATSEARSSPDHFWLCRDGELQRLANPCPDRDDHFLADLLHLQRAQPDLAALTLHVPPLLATPAVALPALPVKLAWRVHEDAPVATASPWLVQAPAPWHFLFTAANSVPGARWQLSAEATAAQVWLGTPATAPATARVLWHDEPAAWRQHDGEPAYQYWVDGTRLHLRLPAREPLPSPALLATLLQRSAEWLQRGDAVTLLPAPMSLQSQPALHGEQRRDMTPWLWLLAALLLLLERGLAHARR